LVVFIVYVVIGLSNMGRYLVLARKALTDLKVAQQVASAPAAPRTDALTTYDLNDEGLSSPAAATDDDINDGNDRRVPADILPAWADADNPAVQAAQAEAERLGVLGRSARELNAAAGTGSARYRWIEGDALARLPEPIRGLVCPQPGWTAESWVAYLWLRAGRCDDQHRDTAELYRQAARLLRSVEVEDT
jgi:hypothetical protein